MNYDLLTIVVVITALVTFALWRNTNRPKFKQLNKQFRKALWESDPTAMLKAWDSYHISQFDLADDTNWGELELRPHGTPTFYFDRRVCQAFAELKRARKIAA